MKLFCLAALSASASALKGASPHIQPVMKPVVPPAASTALALRGGGSVDAGVWLKALTAFFGMYGVGFVLVPDVAAPMHLNTSHS